MGIFITEKENSVNLVTELSGTFIILVMGTDFLLLGLFGSKYVVAACISKVSIFFRERLY